MNLIQYCSFASRIRHQAKVDVLRLGWRNALRRLHTLLAGRT